MDYTSLDFLVGWLEHLGQVRKGSLSFTTLATSRHSSLLWFGGTWSSRRPGSWPRVRAGSWCHVGRWSHQWLLGWWLMRYLDEVCLFVCVNVSYDHGQQEYQSYMHGLLHAIMISIVNSIVVVIVIMIIMRLIMTYHIRTQHCVVPDSSMAAIDVSASLSLMMYKTVNTMINVVKMFIIILSLLDVFLQLRSLGGNPQESQTASRDVAGSLYAYGPLITNYWLRLTGTWLSNHGPDFPIEKLWWWSCNEHL